MQNKTIGLIGGIGWASTLEYYRLINESVVARMGPTHSARIVLSSLNQFDFTSRAAEDGTDSIVEFLVAEAARLQAAGADCLLLCANGAHRFAAQFVPRIALPFISIVDETSKQVQQSGVKRVGLLGVKQTMSGSFYHDSLQRFGIETVVPSAADQDVIHDIIYRELVHGIMTEPSRAIFIGIIGKFAEQGIDAVILGCTEIPLLIEPHHVDVKLFSTTAIHCNAAVDFAFAG